MDLFFRACRIEGVFTSFAFDYLAGKRNTWKNIADYQQKFNVNDAILKSFYAFAAKYYKLNLYERPTAATKSLLIKTIKSEIARQIWIEEGYYRIVNSEDKEISAALKEIGKF
jgi:hypothetical protein